MSPATVPVTVYLLLLECLSLCLLVLLECLSPLLRVPISVADDRFREAGNCIE